LKAVSNTIVQCCTQQLSGEEEPGEDAVFWWKIMNRLPKPPWDCTLAVHQITLILNLERQRWTSTLLIEIVKYMQKKPVTIEHFVRLIPLVADRSSTVAILIDELFLRLDSDGMLQFIAMAREEGQFELFVTNLLEQGCSQPPACLKLAIVLLARVLDLEDIWNEDILGMCKLGAEIPECRQRALEILMLVNDRMIKRGGAGLLAEFPDDDELCAILERDDGLGYVCEFPGGCILRGFRHRAGRGRSKLGWAMGLADQLSRSKDVKPFLEIVNVMMRSIGYGFRGGAFLVQSVHERHPKLLVVSSFGISLAVDSFS
jgi:hypothetical protein